MNKNTLKALLASVLFLALLATTVSSCAIGIIPYADSIFDVATVSLSTSKSVTYKCRTYHTQDTLSVTQCWLEKKDGNSWKKVCDLTPPSTANTNAQAYTRVVEYNIGSGTFRVGAVFNASGYEITRFSNTRTY